MFDHLVGQNLERYTIVRKTGENRLWTVFRAYDPNYQRDVAVHILHRQASSRPGFAAEFIQAARAASHLEHPNLVKVFDSGDAQGYRYVVTEFIPGDDLEGLLGELRRSRQWILLGEAIQLVRQLALALDYVRAQGGAPRLPLPAEVRIKPVQGIELPYQPVLTDLGLNWLAEAGQGSLLALAPAYVSPEEASGQAVDPRSEVYTLGVLLFELATGQLPFPIGTADDAVRYHTRQPAPPPRSLRPDLPEPLERLILASLQKNPEARPPNPGAVAAELARLAPQANAIASPPPGLERAVSLLAPYRQSLAEAPTEGVEPARYTPAPTVAAVTQPSPATDADWQPPVELALSQAQLSVEPGNSANTVIILRNRGLAQGFFRVILDGIPPAWALISPELVQLAPGEQREVSLSIQPPRSPQSRAGRYPLVVRAVRQGTNAQAGETRGALTVTPFSRFSSRLNNGVLRSGEMGQVAISNLGNTQTSFNILFRDPEGELAFAQPQSQVRLAEGQTAVTEFRAGLRRPRWIGSEKTHNYSVAVASSMGETQTHSGEVVSQAIIPAWMIGALLVIFLCIAGSFALYLARSGLQVTGATATVQAQLTGTAQSILSTIQAGTATADFLANANQATLQAVTATAAWQAADTDGDGLNNQQELDLRTSPDNPDTDGDALKDGDEVARKTDPLKPDTDGDGLTDGAEVAGGSDPLRPDTDGDGLPDGQDPNPLATSTPAPNTQATAAAATAQAAATSAAATAQGAAAQTAAAGTAAANAAATSAAATAQGAAAQTAAAGTAAANAAATSAAATAQAAAALTATANAGPAATAAAATALANAATQTAQARVRVAYIFAADEAAGRDFQTLLQANGFLVDLIRQDAAPSTNFQPYRAILIGPDTGQGNRWGDDPGDQFNALLDSGEPLLGLGEGGYAFFNRADIGTGWSNETVVDASTVQVVDPNSVIWTTPNRVTIPANGQVQLYALNTRTVQVTVNNPGIDITLIGQLPGTTNNYTIVQKNPIYLLWGYSGPPGVMTDAGKAVFVNTLFSIIPR